MSKYVKYIRPVVPSAADGLVAEVYGEMKRDLGALAEPVTLHSPLPELLVGAWGILRESLLVGQVRRGYKEAVAATVAQRNRCPWCVDAHSTMLHATGHGAAVQAFTRHEYGRIQEPTLRGIIQWAAQFGKPNAPNLLELPLLPEEVAELIAVAVTFHYLTRMVNALIAATFLPQQAWLNSAIKWGAGRVLARSTGRKLAPGGVWQTLPEAALADDLAWPAAAPALSGAFTRFNAVVEQTGARILPLPVRELLQSHLATWNGEDAGLSRRWVEEEINDLDGAGRDVARLTLLAARASYQIDEQVITRFRAHLPGDEELVGALAWASFRAARRLGVGVARPVLPAAPQR